MAELWELLEKQAQYLKKGLKRTPGSGNQESPWKRGDLQNETYIAECKCGYPDPKRPERLRFRTAWLRSLVRDARRVRKIPVLVLRWNEGVSRGLVRCLVPLAQWRHWARDQYLRPTRSQCLILNRSITSVGPENRYLWDAEGTGIWISLEADEFKIYSDRWERDGDDPLSLPETKDPGEP